MKGATVGGFSKEANPKRREATGSLATRGQEAIIDQGGCEIASGDAFHVVDAGAAGFSFERANTGTGDSRSPLLHQWGRDRLASLARNGKNDIDHVAGLMAYQHMLNAHYRQR
jgi:hypothetical protein